MESVRREERIPVDVEIRFRYPDIFKAKMRDFCPGGMGAEIPVPIAVDSTVELEIFQGMLLTSGTVRWVNVEEGTWRVGIQFKESDRELLEKIRAIKGSIV